LNLGSASGVSWRIVDVCGRIGTRLVINCVHMLNLGSASGILKNRGCLWSKRDLPLIAFKCGIWAAPPA
jgi:hypothetical protein